MSRTFFIERKLAAVFLEILNEMVVPYIAVMYRKGYKVQVYLTDKEVSQFQDIGFFAVDMEKLK